MSNLLHLTKMKLPKKGTPLALECEVSPDTAPYLVTSSKGLVWVPQTSADGTIKAAVRLKTQPEQFFLDVVEAVHKAGQHWEWGNVLPMTPEGLEEAITHVEEYELGEIEILVPPSVEGEPSPGMEIATKLNKPHRPTSWLPRDLAVIVPKDRTFVGSVYRIGKDIVGVVHNAARGLAIVSSRVEG